MLQTAGAYLGPESMGSFLQEFTPKELKADVATGKAGSKVE